jgi:hypothetical protein
MPDFDAGRTRDRSIAGTASVKFGNFIVSLHWPVNNRSRCSKSRKESLCKDLGSGWRSRIPLPAQLRSQTRLLSASAQLNSVAGVP